MYVLHAYVCVHTRCSQSVAFDRKRFFVLFLSSISFQSLGQFSFQFLIGNLAGFPLCP